VPTRLTLADFLREELDLTGTHLGCEYGVCGACTVQVDGQAARSCTLLAVQADGCEVITVEGLASEERLTPVQQAFWEKHGMQCGFCTSGFVMTITHLLKERPNPTDEEIADWLNGNLCRCTGYTKIAEAVHEAIRLLADERTGQVTNG
jgi:aerobic carbon-monoxide dehydrogenase small subunit